MAVLVGIDEAGFGPILGPLVISSTTFSLPRHLLEADLWHVLNKSVGIKRRRLGGRLLVADSKKVYSKSLGIRHLERTTLACLKCLGKTPKTLAELIAVLCPDSLEQLCDYPWYKNIANYRISSDSADLTIASEVFKNDLAAGNIQMLQLKSCCLEVAHYNRMVNNVKNKASVLFTAVSQLVKEAYDNFGDDELQIIIDRQGGRVRYRKNLQQMFPGMSLNILRESLSSSNYEMRAGSRRMRLHFVVNADSRFFPASLASMVSKYLRELLIDNINRYFIAFYPGLKPTSGYWKDGTRFIEDLKRNVPHVSYDSNQLIRCR